MIVMKLGLYQTQTLNCPICLSGTVSGPSYDKNKQKALVRIIARESPDKYAVCPACFTEIPEKDWTDNYKKRWEKKVKEIQTTKK